MSEPRISLCMIVKDEAENIGNCLLSVCDHVDEILLLDTGSTDDTPAIAGSLGAKVERLTREDCPAAFQLDDEASGWELQVPPPYSNEWFLGDFAEARNRSMVKATGDLVLWLDADDVLEGAEHLRPAARKMVAEGITLGFFPYDYAHDHVGRVVYRQWRERLFLRGSGAWRNAVHEVFLLNPGVPIVNNRFPELLVSHRRKPNRKITPHRNLKILLRMHAADVAAGRASDPRTLYYLGNEIRFLDPVRAVDFYNAYIASSGWDEERASAHMTLGQLYEMQTGEKKPRYLRALREYAAAAMDLSGGPDALFACARACYFLERWDKCVEYTERALAIGSPETLLGANPLERAYRPHLFYNHALWMVGRPRDAVTSCEAGLRAMPEDPGTGNMDGCRPNLLTDNKKFYQDYLRDHPAAAPAVRPQLPQVDTIDLFQTEQLDAPPREMPPAALAMFAVQMWKRSPLPRRLLEALPFELRADPVYRQMVELSYRRDRFEHMPKITLAMIVKNEEAVLARCLESVAPYVTDMVIVDTGSEDKTKEIARSFGATVIDCTPETHPDFFYLDDESTDVPPPYSGKMCLGDFAGARNVSLDHATGDFVIWLDADDVLENGSLLAKLLDDMERRKSDVAWVRYDYGADDKGNVICRLWRERVVRRVPGIRWHNPIHEVMLPGTTEMQLKIDHMFVRHARPEERTSTVSHRNLKVLKRHLQKNPEDPRTLFYFGNEARHVLPDEAVRAYERYVELSGWPEERAFARVALGEIFEERKEYGRAFAQFAAAAAEHSIPEGCFGMARVAFAQDRFTDCVRFTEEGWKRGDPQSVIMINPLARNFAPHLPYHLALNQLGRVQEALTSCMKALEIMPTNDGLLLNAKVFREHLDGGTIRRPRERKGGLDIVMWTGEAFEHWSPKSPNSTGIGGSETAAIEVCKHLAALGHRVTHYSDCAGLEGNYDGVEYKNFRGFGGADCDVFISSRQPWIVDHNIRAGLKFLWVHDIHVGQPSPQMHQWMLKYDRILCLSEWHRRFFMSLYQWLHPSTVIVTRNGIDPSRFRGSLDVAMAGEEGAVSSGVPGDLDIIERLPAKRNRLIFSSSANRGLDVLLDLLPKVRAEVPDAELRVFYGFETWETAARRSNNQAELQQIDMYRKQLSETAGVVWRGRVDQLTLAREMLEAKVWAYPTAFPETYCVTALEAQAACCTPVTTDYAALSETVKFGVRLPGLNTDPGYQEAWVREVINCLKDEPKRFAAAAAGRQWALTQSWKQLAADWAMMFEALTSEVNREIVPRYEQMLGKMAA